MDKEALRAWRDTSKLTQAQAAERFGTSRVSWARWEAGVWPVPEDVAAIIEDGAVEPEVLIAEAAPASEPFTPELEPEDATPPAFDPVKAGLKPWGPRPDGVLARDFTKNPLSKGYQVCSWRVVHGSIPDPLPYDAPEWAGKDAIVTASGRCFHYATGQEIKQWDNLIAVPFKPNDGSHARPRQARR